MQYDDSMSFIYRGFLKTRLIADVGVASAIRELSCVLSKTLRDQTATLPDWPALLDERSLRKFTGLSRNQIRELIASGIVPAARSLAGSPVWSTEEVRRALAAHLGFDQFERQRQQSRRIAKEALDAFESSPVRGRNPRTRTRVHVLPTKR
jgi:predicted DNA-binding transcriptional regulator AlpA